MVGRIAAAHLSQQARQAVANLLRQDTDLNSGGSPSDDVSELLARAAIWPDHMLGGKGPTAPWHYIDIGLFEAPSHIAERCPEGNCIVEKMKQYLVNLKEHRADGKWPEVKELEFLAHFAGDIHQPLHCATDGDAGGNCVTVKGFEPMVNLHAVWDISLVRNLIARDGPGFEGMQARFRKQRKQWRKYGSVEAIAAESFRLALTEVYGKAHPAIPIVPKFIEVQPRACATDAPEAVRSVVVDGPVSYGNESLDVVRMQLYRAGVRLARMLNEIYGD